jgi:recombination protein RecA
MVKNGTKNSGSDNGKLEALEKAIVNIEERFGKGAILRLGEASSEIDIEIIPSGSLALDLALGVGGIPRGRITGSSVQRHQVRPLSHSMW